MQKKTKRFSIYETNYKAKHDNAIITIDKELAIILNLIQDTMPFYIGCINTNLVKSVISSAFVFFRMSFPKCILEAVNRLSHRLL